MNTEMEDLKNQIDRAKEELKKKVESIGSFVKEVAQWEQRIVSCKAEKNLNADEQKKLKKQLQQYEEDLKTLIEQLKVCKQAWSISDSKPYI